MFFNLLTHLWRLGSRHEYETYFKCIWTRFKDDLEKIAKDNDWFYDIRIPDYIYTKPDHKVIYLTINRRSYIRISMNIDQFMEQMTISVMPIEALAELRVNPQFVYSKTPVRFDICSLGGVWYNNEKRIGVLSPNLEKGELIDLFMTKLNDLHSSLPVTKLQSRL